MNAAAYNQYRKNSVYTSTQEELILMMYNGLIKFIMLGISNLEEQNMEKANNSIVRAQDIVIELQSSLDGKYEVAQNLWLLYDYIYRRLVEGNVRKDKEMLAEVLGQVKELKETWAEAIKAAKLQNRKKQAVANE